MGDLNRAIDDIASEADWLVKRLKLSPEEALEFRTDLRERMTEAIEHGFSEGQRKYGLYREWQDAHPDATPEEDREFYRTLWPEDVAWEEWQEAHPFASKYEMDEAYEDIYGFERDEEDDDE